MGVSSKGKESDVQKIRTNQDCGRLAKRNGRRTFLMFAYATEIMIIFGEGTRSKRSPEVKASGKLANIVRNASGAGEVEGVGMGGSEFPRKIWIGPGAESEIEFRLVDSIRDTSRCVKKKKRYITGEGDMNGGCGKPSAGESWPRRGWL